MKAKGFLIVLIVVVIILGLVGWRVVTKRKSSAVQAAVTKARFSSPPTVATSLVGPSTITDQIQAVGSVTSPNVIKISPTISGLISFLQVREGDKVKAGQVLVKLNPQDLTAVVFQNQANVAQAESKLAQAKLTENPTEVGISAAILQQEAQVSSAQAADIQARSTYSAQVAAAQSQIADAQAKVAAAKAGVEGATASVQSAQANVTDSKTKLSRTLSLYQQNFIAAQDVDDAKAAEAVSEGALAVAKGNLTSAKANVNSANATLNVAVKQQAITVQTAKADISAKDALLLQAKQATKIANANLAQNPAYQENLAALQEAVSAAQAQLQQSQAKLGETTVISPIDGVITERDADPGSIAAPGQTVLVVQSLKWVYVDAYIPIEKSPEIYEGQKASITFSGISNRVFTGTLAQISPSADPTSRQFLARIKLSNPNSSIKPGMFGNVTIGVQSIVAPMTVPREAVTLTTGTSATVYVVDDKNIAHLQTVQVGVSNAKIYQIVSGLQPGDRVITLSYATVKDGTKVNPQKI